MIASPIFQRGYGSKSLQAPKVKPSPFKQEDEEDSPEERAQLMGEILSGLFGDTTLAPFAKGEKSLGLYFVKAATPIPGVSGGGSTPKPPTVGKTPRVAKPKPPKLYQGMPVGKEFQGPSGRWFVVREQSDGKKKVVPAKDPNKQEPEKKAKKGHVTAEEAHKQIQDALKNTPEGERPAKVTDILSGVTVKGLHDLKKLLNVGGRGGVGGGKKDELAKKIAERIMGSTVAQQAPTPPPAPVTPQPPQVVPPEEPAEPEKAETPQPEQATEEAKEPEIPPSEVPEEAPPEEPQVPEDEDVIDLEPGDIEGIEEEPEQPPEVEQTPEQEEQLPAEPPPPPPTAARNPFPPDSGRSRSWQALRIGMKDPNVDADKLARNVMRNLTDKGQRLFMEGMGIDTAGKTNQQALADYIRSQKPPEIQPKPEEAAPQATSSEPQAAAPDFSGVDSLGREWQDGKLTGRRKPPDTRNARNLDLANTPLVKLDPIPQLDPKNHRLLEKALHLKGHSATIDQLHSRLLTTWEMPDKVVNNLKTQGLIEEDKSKHVKGLDMYRLSKKGVLAVMAARGSIPADLKEMPHPTSKRAVNTWARVFPCLSFAQQKEICKQYDVPELATQLASGKDPYTRGTLAESVAAQLTAVGEELVSGNIATNLRAAKPTIEAVNKLSALNLKSKQEVETERDAVHKEAMEAFDIAHEAFKKVYPDNGSPLAWNDPQRRVLYNEYLKLSKKSEELRDRENELRRQVDEAESKMATAVKDLFKLPDDQITPVAIGGFDKIDWGSTPEAKEEIRKEAQKTHTTAAEWLHGIVGRGASDRDLPTYEIVADKDTDPSRAHYNPEKHAINPTMFPRTATAVHEIAHGIEQHMPGALSAALAFIRHRCGKEPYTLMREVNPDAGYDDVEAGRKDDFDKVLPKSSAYYVGKSYGSATEVISMGVELLYKDPVNFARKDPEYCTFIVGILQGNLRYKSMEN